MYSRKRRVKTDTPRMPPGLRRTIEYGRPPKTMQIDSLLLESQETLGSFSFNSSWFKLSFYSNRTTLFMCYSPKVRKSYSFHVNVTFI